MIFAPTKPEKIRTHQLREAERALLEHEAAAEFNTAMAAMLRQRIKRLAQTKDQT